MSEDSSPLLGVCSKLVRGSVKFLQMNEGPGCAPPAGINRRSLSNERTGTQMQTPQYKVYHCIKCIRPSPAVNYSPLNGKQEGTVLVLWIWTESKYQILPPSSIDKLVQHRAHILVRVIRIHPYVPLALFPAIAHNIAFPTSRKSIYSGANRKTGVRGY